MGKMGKATIWDLVDRWEKYNKSWYMSGFNKFPPYPNGLRDLANGLVEIEDVPEELLKRISKLLGERWIWRRKGG